MSFCSNCNQANVSVLSKPTLIRKCEFCGLEEKASNEESLLAFQTIMHANSGDPTLHSAMLAHAGKDPVNKKIRRWCRKCKSETIMSRLNLGDSETPFDICEQCGDYFPSVTDTKKPPNATPAPVRKKKTGKAVVPGKKKKDKRAR